MKIEKLTLCNGCHTCYSLCPKQAIKMVSNDEGFLYPQIDEGLCVKCGLCEKKCPVLNPLGKENEQTSAYAIINNNEKIRLESSSGGVFTSLAENVINQNGIVFGAKFDSDFDVIHRFTDSIEGLADFRGSKYVQSAIGEAYKDCKNFLEEGRQVLFSGTPCQIAGLQSFLGKKYDNLLCVDFICHGVPSFKLFSIYKQFVERKNCKQLKAIFFRDKTNGWADYAVKEVFEDNTTTKLPHNKHPYMNLYLGISCYRESCYDCKFKGKKYFSDITIADFWGIQNEYPELDDDKGTSFVITHSDKGQKIIDCLSNCTVKIIPLEKGVKYNPSYVRSVIRPTKRDVFFLDLKKYSDNKISFDKLVKKYTVDSIFVRSYRFLRRCLGKIKMMILNEK